VIAAIDTPTVDWFALSPVLALLAASGICLLAAVLVPKRVRRPLTAGVCALGFAGAFVAAALVFGWTDTGTGEVADSIRRDQLAAFAQILIAGSGVLAVGVSYSQRSPGRHTSEYYALLAAAGAGMAFLASANNLMTLFLGLEWFSLCLYVLCALEYDVVGSLEAGLKYLIVGSFGSAFLLFGSALVYGATGELGFPEIAAAISAQGLGDDVLLLVGLAMMIAGLGFKASAAPFHMWTPDVYEGAPTPVTAFMSAATKAVALILTLRVLVTAFSPEGLPELWTIAIAVIACASLAIGNLAALVQRNLKRMLAYSSISHAGFMLIAIAADNELGGRALLYYLIPYCAMSIGAFAVVAARERELGQAVTLDNIAGMGWERPMLGVAMWAFMLGFAGFPPTGGFLGKFYVFAAAYEHGWTWLVIVGIAATAVSLYYYLGVVRALYMRPSVGLSPVTVAGGSPPRDPALSAAVLACLAVTIGSFFAVQPLVDLAGDAISSSLPF
jgi:NADH-quinone oxidoreductase subunit N